MAVNKPIGDNARKGAVKKRSQRVTKIHGEETWAKRSRETGRFLDQKKAPAESRTRACAKKNKPSHNVQRTSFKGLCKGRRRTRAIDRKASVWPLKMPELPVRW